ncbi:PREDICTED: A-kinase anchor protein 9-like [Nanorana parkeri]|uniref:A-kinase anchor protein 9-like n=1 Tax=Nanorana parkeri TaxID=125878 RepID=UPI000854EEE5|nr:PREDICTED: A-kinase anchor protein 9-like [Nanorana parkeri]
MRAEGRALDDGHQKMVKVEAARDDIYQEIEYVKDLCLQPGWLCGHGGAKSPSMPRRSKRMETYQTPFTPGDESSQMWTLNKRLEAYLSRVQALEEENELLRAEIHHLRREPGAPSVRKYHQEIMKLRDALDDGHQSMVEVEAARDDIYQEIEYVKDLCLQEKHAQEEARREMSESKRLLEEERRAQSWLKERLVQLEVEMEDILKVHEEEKAAMEEEISSFSQRLDSFKVAPVAFQPVNVEDYSARLSQIWQGAVEDYKNEVSALEGGLSEAKENLRKVLEENKQSQLQLQNLDRELLSLKSRKEMLEDVLGKQWLETQEEEGRLQLEIETLEKEKRDLRAQIAQILEERQQLMHLKMSLSLEVATYRSLLEAENTRIYPPTADYKPSSPFSDSVLEKNPLRKRQAESTKTLVARDYRLTSTKRQSAEKSEQLSHTPSRRLNVKSTSFPSRPSPVTKEFQKVSSVLQSQSLRYTKASTEKAATTLSSGERRIERRPPTEDVSKKSKVENISHTYSQGSSKAMPDKTVRSQAKEQPLDKIVYSKHEAEVTETEALENGFLLPGEREIQQKIDHLESSLKTVEDQHPIVHDVALEDQQGSLKVDVNVQDLQSKAQEDVHQTDLPSQVFGNVEADLVVQSEDVVTQVVTCQTVLFEKQEVVQSLENQNIETTSKEDVTCLRIAQAISEPYTADAKAELLAITPTHEQELSTTLLPAEREEPKALSSDVVCESEPLAQQEQDSNGQVSFDLEQAIGLSSDVKEDTKQRADGKDTLLVDQGFEITDTEQGDSSLEKVETESKLQEEQVVVDQQILSTPKQSDNQVFNDEKVIEDKSQGEEEPVGKCDIIFDGAESLETCSDGALNSSQVNELSTETDLRQNTEPQSDEVIVSQEFHSLSCEIDNTQMREREEETTTENEELQEDFDLKLAQSESLLEESEDSSNTGEQEENQLSIKQEPKYFEGEVKKSDVEESSQEHDTEQPSETYRKEELAALPEDIIQVSEDSQELIQEEQKSLELCSSVRESEIYVERKTQIICVTEQITEQFIVDDKEFGDHLDAENSYFPEAGLKEIQQELESLEFSGKEKEIRDILSTVEADGVQITKLESEEATSQLSDDTQDTVQVFENIEDSQDVKLEKQKSPEARDVEQDQSNTEDKVQLVDGIDDGDQSVDKSQELLSKQDSSIVPETEQVDSLQSFQEEQKDTELAQTEQQDNKLSFDEDSSPPETKETIFSASDVIEEPKFDGQSSLSFGGAENDVNASVEEQASSQFSELKEEFGQTYTESVDLISEELKGFEPTVAEEGDVPTETDFTASLQKEVVEQPAEEEPEPHITHDVTDAPTITNRVQENQPEEHESEETKTIEEDVQFDESGQAYQELVDAVACALLREEVELESPLSADRVQEPETSYEHVSDAEIKVTFQDKSEEITYWTEKVILQESRQVVSTSTYSEEHEVDTQLVHQACDPTDVERSAMTDLEPERKIPENETEECIPESDNVDSGDVKPVSQESKGPGADQEPGFDHETLCDTQPEITVQKATAEEYSSKDTQEETSYDNYEDVSKKTDTTENEEESKDSRDLEADQASEQDQQHVSDAETKTILQEESTEEYSSQDTEEKTSQEDSETVSKTTEPEPLAENEKDSKDSGNPEADQELELDQRHVFDTESKVILQQESSEEYSSQDVEEKTSPETAQDTLAENKDSMDPEADREAEIDQEDVSDSKISYQQESVERYTREGAEEEISQVSCETVSETVKKDTSEENEEDSKDSRKPESDPEPEIDHESLSGTEAKITYQQASVLDSDKGADEEIREETSEVVSTMIENVFSEKNEEVEQLAAEVDESAVPSTDHESHTTQIKAETCISGKENIASDAEPISQESRDPEPDQKPELVQETLSDTEQEVGPQQEDADDHFSKGSEEQTTQDTLEIVTKVTEWVTREEDEQDGKDFRDSGAYEGQDLVEEPPFDTEPPFTLEEKKEEVCFSEDVEEEIRQETVEPISKTAEEDTMVENQEDTKYSKDSEAEQGQDLVEEPLLGTEPRFNLEEKKEEVCFSEDVEEEIRHETEEPISKTVEEDTTAENQGDIKDSKDSVAEQGQGLVEEPLLDTEPQFTLEEKNEDVCFSEDVEKEIRQETVEPISKTAEEDTTVDNQEAVKDSKDSEAEQGQDLVEEPLLGTEPRFNLEEKKEEVCFSEDVEEEIRHETEEPISKTVEEDTTAENQGDIKDSKDSVAEQGQGLVEEPLLDTEPQFTLEEKNEDVCFSEDVEKEIRQETVEPISKTAEEDTTVDNQEAVKDSKDSEAEQGQDLVEEPLLGTEPRFNLEEKKEEVCFSEDVEEEIRHETEEPISKTVEEDTTAENQGDIKDSKDSVAEQGQGLVEEPLLDTEPQFTLEEKNEDVCFSEDVEKEIRQETVEPISKTAEEDTTVDNQEAVKDSKDSEAEQGQDLVEEPLLGTEPRFNLEEKKEEVCFSEDVEEEIRHETEEPISKTVEEDTTAENQGDIKDSKDSVAEQGQGLVEEPLLDTEPQFTLEEKNEDVCFSEDVEKEIRQETVEPISKTAEEDTTVDNQEAVKDSKDSEAEQGQDLVEEPLLGTEPRFNLEEKKEEVCFSEDVEEEIRHETEEPISKTVEEDTTAENQGDIKDSKDSVAEQGQGLVEEPLLDTEPQFTLEEKNEDVCFSEDVEKEIRQETVEPISKTAEEDTTVDNQEAVKDSKDSEAEQGQDLVEEPLLGTEPRFNLEEKKEEVCFSEDVEEEIRHETEEPISKTVEEDTTAENQGDIKDSKDSVAEQGQGLVEEPLLDTEPQFTLEEKNEDVCFSEDVEKEIRQETVEPISKTAEEDTTVDNQEAVKDSKDSEAEQGQDLVEEPLLGTEPRFNLEEKKEEVCFSEDVEEEIRHETEEPISKTVEEDTTAENQGDIKDSKDSVAEQGQGLVEEPLLDTEPQFTLEEKNEDVCFSEDVEKEIRQETVEPISKTAEEDTTVDNQEAVKDSKDSEAEQGQDLVEEPLLDTEPQFNLEEKREDVCFSEDVEKEIRQETEEPISKTAEEDTTAENQEDIKDAKDSVAEQGQGLVEEPLLDTEPKSTLEEKNEDVCFSKAVLKELKKVINQEEEEGSLPEIRKEDEMSGFNNPEETTQFNGYEPVGKEMKDPKVDQEPEYDNDSQRDEEETHGLSCDAKDVNQDVNAEVCLTEDYSTSEEKQIHQLVENDAELEQDRLTMEGTKQENQSLDSKLEDSVSASDDTQNIAQWGDPEATIPESFDSTYCIVLNAEVEPDSAVNIYTQETELDSYQFTEPKAPSQQETEDEHLKQSGEEKEVSEENYEADSTAKDYNESEETEEIVPDQKEPEDDPKIPFSLTIIQNNLRFTSENNAEARPEKEECELSTDGTDLVLDEKESADLQNDDIDHESLNKEEAILEDKDFTESKQEDEDIKEKEEEIVSELSYQVSTELNTQIPGDQANFLETETNEQRKESATASETESETILVEQSIEQKLNAEIPTLASDFEGPTEEQSEIEDVPTPSNLEEDNSKSDESLDSQDISMYSQKSEDFEISKDYQLEQTLPDSTPLPNLDEEFEDLAEDKVILTSGEAQTVAGSFCLPELKEEVLDSSLESQSSQVATETGAEEPKQELANVAESSSGTLDEVTFGNKHLEASEVSKAENTESDESLNSQEEISIPCADYQLEKTLPDTTPLSKLTDGSGMLAKGQEISEPPQTDDVKEVQSNIEQSDLTAYESEKEAESVSETTELFPTAEDPESKLAPPLNIDVTRDESTYRIPEQSAIISGDDRDSVEEEEDQWELITKEEISTGSVTDNTETEEAIILGDHNGDLPQDQSDESYEGLKTTSDEPLHEESNRDDLELIEKTTETSVALESDRSIASDETTPNVTAIGHETDPEDDKGEETSDVKVKEISDKIEKVVLAKVEDEAILATKPSQEASLPEHIEFHTSDEEKDTTGEISDSSFDSNSGNEREAAEDQHSSPTESNIYVKTVNGLHEGTIVQATLDLEDLLINGHSTGEQSKIVISERKTIVKVEEDIISTHTQDIIEESVLKFAASECKSEGLFQSLLEKSELKEGTRLDEPSAVEYVDSATDETNYTKKTIMPYLRDSDFTNQAEIQPSLGDEGLIVDTKQQTVQTHQERDDAWSSDE